MAQEDAVNQERGCPTGLAPPADKESPRVDASAFVRRLPDGHDGLELMVQGAKCANCIQKIEGGLNKLPGVTQARLNLSTGRLNVAWRPGAVKAGAVMETLASLGYAAAPFDPEASQARIDEEGRFLLRCLAVAGFASMNIMMLSVPIWGGVGEMGAGVRTLLHWISALIAVPSALYAGRPFFASAWRALKARHANMDVPISLAVFLTLAMSLYETAQQAGNAYFDGVVMLLFFLLIGRYLDHRLREQARSAAKDLLALQSLSAARIDPDGVVRAIMAREIAPGDRLVLAAGDRAPVDGVIESGASDFDCSFLTGETAPETKRAGAALAAGAINLTRPIILRASKNAANSTVAELARLIEVSEQGRAKFVRIAEKAARLYVPVVHSLALATFVGWMLLPQAFGHAPVGLHDALLKAVAVLIITCPCALGLAVPAVQIVASGRLFKSGILVKSGDALERLAEVDRVVLDKTGTLTLGKARLIDAAPGADLAAAATLARASRHPLSRALAEAAGPGLAPDSLKEVPGEGLEGKDGVRLGKKSFAAPNAPEKNDHLEELWFSRPGRDPVRFTFADALRPEAFETVAALKRMKIDVELASGDRAFAVERAAKEAGITLWRAGMRPEDKIAHVEALAKRGRKVLMLGDGVNDAAALAASYVSASPGGAIDVAQSASDVVFEGASLAPVARMIQVARDARARVRENLWLSALYNLVAVPIAVAGLVTPMIAALAMAGSSIAVTLNALRLKGKN